MKKIIKSIIIIVCAICAIWMAKQWWYGIFSGYFPWEKSFCFNYEDYRDTLYNYRFCAQSHFLEDIPEGSSELKVISKQDGSYNRYTGYSITLDETIYYETVNERMGYYSELKDVKPLTELIYIKQSDEQWSIVELDSLDVDISFISKIISHTEQKQDYYVLVLVKEGLDCYIGLAVNDKTHEIIEFSIEKWEDV